ncbi:MULTISPECIES: PilZ domain-containing protein [unclassified Roseitalea]|uniref:PilZ domain-containing protein n=1 Tax=unclassified Roseitalea TaxID=2639107 RepID=UPI00273FEE64|nr:MULTISPECIES: PilZ domain-containing protein [unclassified Roseitalea]
MIKDQPGGERPVDSYTPRGARRQRVLKQGFVSFNEQFSAIDCTVRDLSETGARLAFDGLDVIPDRFTLHIPLDGIQVPCERRWTRGRLCGVAFTGPATPSNLIKRQKIDLAPPDLAAPDVTPAATAEESQPAPDPGSERPPRPAVPFGRRR